MAGWAAGDWHSPGCERSDHLRQGERVTVALTHRERPSSATTLTAIMPINVTILYAESGAPCGTNPGMGTLHNNDNSLRDRRAAAWSRQNQPYTGHQDHDVCHRVSCAATLRRRPATGIALVTCVTSAAPGNHASLNRSVLPHQHAAFICLHDIDAIWEAGTKVAKHQAPIVQPCAAKALTHSSPASLNSSSMMMTYSLQASATPCAG